VESSTLKVYGMTCTLCSAIIEAGVEKLSGIHKVNVSYASERASLQYDASTIQLDEIKILLKNWGFRLKKAKLPEQAALGNGGPLKEAS
jgi:Cation transport ATPase